MAEQLGKLPIIDIYNRYPQTWALWSRTPGISLDEAHARTGEEPITEATTTTEAQAIRSLAATEASRFSRNKVVTAIREQVANLIASGQPEPEAEANAAKAYFYLRPEQLTQDNVEALPQAVQAVYDQLHNVSYLPDPEGDARKAAAAAKADEDAAAAVTEEYRIKRVAKVVNAARAEQAPDIDAAMKRNFSRAEAEQRYPLKQYLSEAVAPTDIEAVDAAEAKVKSDWFSTGIGDGSGEGETE